ncbi:DUF1156 domain-containing protein [Halorubrum vacuolatum]|uniref:Adenine-specific DNA methylase, contains a Zn-ribbon domain n=1 Tax=Halorubrum vacuolatum TaxID=63740 RepID=A0A238W922_HALVU|nr:DUF1156 domain-containing protein [Halorubrum vacuolatum]SNR42907.1 Adenine-specific DNA methylase, contains a Zn-ribbon domain [Halorubrum vacuolatum]
MSETTKKLRQLKIEQILPTEVVGIENMKETKSGGSTMSSHRLIHPWFARRPTTATRLAVLSSILPSDYPNDKLLRLMKIGPKRLPEGESLIDYIERKSVTEENRSGTIPEHYGYDYPHNRSPTKNELNELHETLRQHWDGDLPVLLDPTSGSGTIPLESLRYGLPTKANELNPVAWLLNKAVLEYPTQVGNIREDVKDWAEQIDKYASEELEPYFPSDTPDKNPSHYFCTYSIECPSCGSRLPLANKWWFYKQSSGNAHAIKPVIDGNTINYQHLTEEEANREGFNPSEGTVENADAECPTCTVVIEGDTIKEKFRTGAFEYEICGVKYKSGNGSEYRGTTQKDRDAFKKARDKVSNNLNYATLLTTDVSEGNKTKELRNYGITQWRDLFSPRQLLSHAVYLEAFEEYKQKIRSTHDGQEAEAIITLLSLSASKLIERNCRAAPLRIDRGYAANMFGTNNFAFQWTFAESNMFSGSLSYLSAVDDVIENYEEIVGYFSEVESTEISVNQGDAASLDYPDESIDAVVVDPPYGNNVMYAELSDAFYVWLREYLQDIFPEEFSSETTNKSDEAVENIGLVEQVGKGDSKQSVARKRYEEKMSDIFSECFNVLQPGGVLTVYFTDKEAGAWDALTMSLINSGFLISATHTVTSEKLARIGMRDVNSADSTLLIACRKPPSGETVRGETPSLWSDVKMKTRKIAKEKAEELLQSSVNISKTDLIIGAFGPTLRVFTEEYPVVDAYDDQIRPEQALEQARAAVTEVLIEEELGDTLDNVDSLTKWYVLMWLIYERPTVPYDDANQLGLGVGVQIDEIKRDTKIWSKSKDKLILQGQSDRVRDYTALEAGEKRRKRAYPVDPRNESYPYVIDSVHAALNVLDTKGSDYTWNWLNDRALADDPQFRRTVESLLKVIPNSHDDFETLVNLVSGDTGQLLDIDAGKLIKDEGSEDETTTLNDF